MEVKALEKLVEYYHNNKLSHAYLIETNNIEKCLDDLKEVIKQIFCIDKYDKSCTKCNICNLINQNFLPSLVIIEPEGSSIKKEQILELKNKFSSIPIYTKENIYIIKDALKLTDSSANTMLKFIEEPEDNIIGFFITNNANNVLTTIKSRCELIKANYDIDALDLSILENDSEELKVITEYLEKIELEKQDLIMYNRDILLNKYTEREDIKTIFNIILLIYEEVLNKFLIKSSKVSLNNWDFLLKQNPEKIIKKTKLITKVIEDLDYNVNIELLLDKFVIELSDLNE